LCEQLGNDESEDVFHGSHSISSDEQRHGLFADEDFFTDDAALLIARSLRHQVTMR
jgi:hypothetical protein